jgi:hypothetical protein
MVTGNLTGEKTRRKGRVKESERAAAGEVKRGPWRSRVR